ncbi:hypothetical protein CEXT_527781 [Caerostris extrusa]|uniref:Uncharacterized protein n=1 Tax=Caerostris extrusa TaxID=172846 RepID=A0AAV4XRL2_CAEEX|nr:hypothetical protein CEXT_527781 [Caerostris extrusa]
MGYKTHSQRGREQHPWWAFLKFVFKINLASVKGHVEKKMPEKENIAGGVVSMQVSKNRFSSVLCVTDTTLKTSKFTGYQDRVFLIGLDCLIRILRFSPTFEIPIRSHYPQTED